VKLPTKKGGRDLDRNRRALKNPWNTMGSSINPYTKWKNLYTDPKYPSFKTMRKLTLTNINWHIPSNIETHKSHYLSLYQNLTITESNLLPHLHVFPSHSYKETDKQKQDKV